MTFESTYNFDYTYVHTVACVVLYDDFSSAPRVTKIEPAETTAFIENLTVAIYEQSKLAGGKIPYSIIREVSENFIHANFREIVVSILDNGNTIRFADQGPGIQEKEKAQKPGFTSAIEPMRNYIRGVGSGFPLVCDYLDGKNGSIVIEDNLNTGAVVTISLEQQAKPKVVETVAQTKMGTQPQEFVPRIPLTQREQTFLTLFLHEGDLGVTELRDMTGEANSTIHNTLRKLEEAGLIQYSYGKKRNLTDLGQVITKSL